ADAPWAAQLARDLREAGVLVVDEPRDDDVILAVVTPGYVASPPDSELIRAHRSAAVDGRPGAVPLLRSGAVRPGELNGLVAGEFQDDTRYVVSLFDLVLTLYAIPFDHPAFDALRTTLRATWNRHLVEHAPATEVYLSYSWTEGSNTVADELDAAFQARGVTVVRDRRDAGYRASIGEFMERIGRGRCVVLVISDAYLRSPNCLFELLRIARHGEFADRVFPVVLPDAAIHRPQDRIGYVRHWEQQISELDEAVRSVSSANLHGFRDDIDLYTEIRAQVPRLAEILADMNTLTVDLHRDGGFAQLIDAVLTRLDK
ncbi:MAG: toll/interleukin-1 receptor domain-containing protein, partial [Actinoplanes sp.]